MTREEYNKQFLLGLDYEKRSGIVSNEMKILLQQLIREISISERYKYLNEDMKYICVVFAYEACIKHIWNFNPEKSSNAFSYIVIIIRSSFARTIGRLKNNEITIKTI